MGLIKFSRFCRIQELKKKEGIVGYMHIDSYIKKQYSMSFG